MILIELLSRGDHMTLNNNLRTSPEDRLGRAAVSLEGLSVGDAFGERFFVHPDVVEGLIRSRAVRSPPWGYTDDTAMALSIAETLRRHAGIEQDLLAASFAERFDPPRGYGAATYWLLTRLRRGESWQELAPNLFDGEGSYGNGAAMRVAPVGAYFADDLGSTAEHASRSAVVTHAHPEAVAGAVAVAMAAAWAWRLRGSEPPGCAGFLDLVLPHIPDSIVSRRVRQARDLDQDCSVELAVAALGNGEQVAAQDTVPFALWCAGHQLDHFEEAMWLTVSGLGDRDTTCAIVGGIVACFTGVEAIPTEWRQAREPLPEW
jgi:ADP-ribosylglycohydrolase